MLGEVPSMYQHAAKILRRKTYRIQLLDSRSLLQSCLDLRCSWPIRLCCHQCPVHIALLLPSPRPQDACHTRLSQTYQDSLDRVHVNHSCQEAGNPLSHCVCGYDVWASIHHCDIRCLTGIAASREKAMEPGHPQHWDTLALVDQSLGYRARCLQGPN